MRGSCSIIFVLSESLLSCFKLNGKNRKYIREKSSFPRKKKKIALGLEEAIDSKVGAFRKWRGLLLGKFFVLKIYGLYIHIHTMSVYILCVFSDSIHIHVS